MEKIFAQDGVFFHATLPLIWRTKSGPTDDEITVWMYDNVTLLRALATIEAFQPENEVDTATGTGKTLQHLEFKIGLTLNLIAKLLTQSIILPHAHPVFLSADGMEWICGEPPPTQGEDILISTFISPKLPQPLVLPAKVAAVRKEEGGTRIYATFTHLNEEARDWLSRTVFRYHRRAIHTQHHE